MADMSEVYEALRAADTAGDKAAAARLAAYIEAQPAAPGGGRRSPMQMADDGFPSADPTSGMSEWQKFAAGYGKAGADIVRGAGQRVGDLEETLSGRREAMFPTGADVTATSQQDQPLMASRSGQAGNIVGNLTGYAPLAMVPGASTVLGAGAIGAGVGLAQPSENASETGKNALLGGLFSGGVVGAGRLLPRAVEAVVSPFTQSGQEELALSALNRFARDPNAIRNAAVDELVPGSKPTLAEVTGDPGIAQLQRASHAQSPEVGSAMAESRTARIGAWKNALLDIAGSHDDRLMMEEARRATADEFYGKAYEKGIDIRRDPATGHFRTNAQITGIKGEITKLMRTPAMADAVKEARRLAANDINSKYTNMKDLAGSVQGLDYVQRALGDKIEAAVKAGGKNEARILGNLRSRLLTTVDNLSPDYAAARASFAEMSKPINRMEVGSYLYDKLFPALSDLGAERMTQQKFAAALKDGDAMAAKATGFAGAKLRDVLSPQDMDMIINVGKDLGREAAAIEKGKVPGSPTAQYLAAANIMRSIFGPLGLPDSLTERIAQSAVGETFGKWKTFNPLDVPEKRIQNKLGQMLTDPKLAQQVGTRQAASAQRMVPLSQVGRFALPVAAFGGSASLPANQQ